MVKARLTVNMSLLKRMTNAIHLNFAGSAKRRSEDLWDICQKSIPIRAGRYLDIGTYSGHNALTFGANGYAVQIVGIDLTIPPSNVLRELKQADLLVGDGLHLPLGSSQFDMISMFSVLEHVPDPSLLCQEVFRTLKKGGIIIIQVPNRLFPVELHCGIPLLFYLPKKIRNKVLVSTGYGYMLHTQVPSLKELLSIIQMVNSASRFTVKKVNYSESIIPVNMRRLYTLVQKSGFLNVLPMGYAVLIKKG